MTHLWDSICADVETYPHGIPHDIHGIVADFLTPVLIAQASVSDCYGIRVHGGQIYTIHRKCIKINDLNLQCKYIIPLHVDCYCVYSRVIFDFDPVTNSFVYCSRDPQGSGYPICRFMAIGANGEYYERWNTNDIWSVQFHNNLVYLSGRYDVFTYNYNGNRINTIHLDLHMFIEHNGKGVAALEAIHAHGSRILILDNNLHIMKETVYNSEVYVIKGIFDGIIPDRETPHGTITHISKEGSIMAYVADSDVYVYV